MYKLLWNILNNSDSIYNTYWYGTKYNMLDSDSVYYSSFSIQSYIDNIRRYARMVETRGDRVWAKYTEGRLNLRSIGNNVRMEYYKFYGEFKQI